MKSRGKSTPYAELIIVVGVLLPISACTWANPWQSTSAAAKDESAKSGDDSTAKKDMPRVKLNKDEQQVYDKYHSMPGQASGWSSESRAIESRLGYK